MLKESDIGSLIEREPIKLEPLQFLRLQGDHPREVDAVFEVKWGTHLFRFVAEFKARATPQALASAVQHAKSHAFDVPGSYPLVVVPYLSPSNIDELERQGASAVDLCGNGVVQVPRHWIVVRSGRPNRFRRNEPLRGAYRGVASLVARALAVQPVFARVSDVQNFIEARGGRITLATVSKALARLEEDLVIARKPGTIRVIQGEKLLMKLRDAYRPPSIRTRLGLKTRLSQTELNATFRAVSERVGARLALTGISSASRHTVMATEPIASFYCSAQPEQLAIAASIDPSGERHFPDVELLQTDDVRVYFDVRNVDGWVVSSPIQTWLELSTGDKRAQEAANALRIRLVQQLENTPSEATNER